MMDDGHKTAGFDDQHAPERDETDSLFGSAAVFARIAERVTKTLASDALDRMAVPVTGDHMLNPGTVIAPDYLEKTRIAAVLIGLVDRPDGLKVILTKRASALRDHSGQIALPGGKMDASDATPAETALREVHEEIGIPAERIEVLGYLGAYLTRTGFRIVPVVARIKPPFTLTINAGEVDEAFEVPFSYLMSEANHTIVEKEWKGSQKRFYAIPYSERNIWGITAAMLRIFYEQLYR